MEIGWNVCDHRAFIYTAIRKIKKKNDLAEFSSLGKRLL